MLKYAEISNEELKTCNVGIGDDFETYISMGFTLMDVEEGYDGIWYLKGYAPKKTLKMFKNEKLNDIKSISDSFRTQLINKDMYIKSSLGFIVDADKDSQDNVQGLIDILPNDELTIQYRDRDNEIHNLNKSQLETILKEMKLNGVELFNQKWGLESQIENARSESELNQIDLTFQMKDFSS